MLRKLNHQLQRCGALEEIWCQRFNRISRVRGSRWIFRMVSRLGDGLFWYVLMLSLPILYGWTAWTAVAHMIGVGVVCTLSYKWLKSRTSRPRPYQVNQAIRMETNPLDKFSFPSGHTLHAVAFSIVLVAYFPELQWLVVPFTALVALSRLVLGLHYPTDVLAGAVIGTVVAASSLIWF